jgi:tetratricopeptide (TPR) repeat protein
VLRNLFRKRPLAELIAEAEDLVGQQRFGEAKLAYDRAAERAQKEHPEQAGALEAQASACCDRLALKRAREAEALHAAGQDELAQEELRHALETVRSAQVREQLRAIERNMVPKQTAAQSRDVAALGDEERLMLITSSWEPLQAEELERYGEPLFDALLAIEVGDGERALPPLLALFEQHADAAYLWLELGRAQLARAALDEAERALRTFLARIGPEEGGAARLLAHRELAHIAHERNDREGAVSELEAAAEALADDPRPLLDLGNYLRLIDRPREAVEVLDLCVAAFGDNEVEWPVTMEVGLACAAAGDKQRALGVLESVLTSLLAKGHTDLPPPAAVTLAQLHEEAGNPTRAADLYRALSQGSDVQRHARYCLEAARLLDVLSLTDEAARMRERARELGADLPSSESTSPERSPTIGG